MTEEIVRWEGFLSKRGDSAFTSTPFKRRYFVLFSTNELQYFAPPAVAVNESECNFASLAQHGFVKKGAISIAEAISVHPSNKSVNVFEIAMPQRTYIVKAADAEEMEKMVQMLQIPVLRSGWMQKQGRINKAWKRRFFVLLGHRLLYFRSESWQQQNRGGAIQLAPETKMVVRTEAARTWVEIVCESRTWAIDAGSEAANISWLELLNEQVQTRKRPPFEVFVCGPPGSGKTTQCAKLSEATGAVHISAGKVLQQHILQMTAEGVLAKEYLDRNQVVPDALVVSMVVGELAQPECASKGWVLDGFPRTVEQAMAMRKLAVMPTKIVVLQITKEQLLSRLAPDETEANQFRSRYDAFATFMLPILRLYKAFVVYVDAQRQEAAVYEEIKHMMRSFKSRTASASDAQHDSDDEVETARERAAKEEQAAIVLQGIARGAARKKAAAAEAEAERKHQERKHAAEAAVAEELARFTQIICSIGVEVKEHRKKGKPRARLLFCDAAARVVHLQKVVALEKRQTEIQRQLRDASKALMGSKECIELAEVDKVVAGLQTEVFKKKGVQAKAAHCFSFVSGKRTVDIEVDSAEEHARLFRGFLLLLEKVRKPAAPGVARGERRHGIS